MSEHLTEQHQIVDEPNPEWIKRINRLALITRSLGGLGVYGTSIGAVGLVGSLFMEGHDAFVLGLFNLGLTISSVNSLYIAGKVSILAQLEASAYGIEKFSPVDQKIQQLNGNIEILEVRY